MIKKLAGVMLYVDNQEEAVKFWRDGLGFTVVSEEELPEGYKAVEVAPDGKSETSITIFEKAFIRKYSPELGMGTPSLMFETEDAGALYEDMKSKGITVGEMTEMAGSKVFNFKDGEDNYFAVSESD
ncbi:VOC family protein [Salinicoccus carnicancri]|uniref:VOC family protein n=1 Tax=Salinicoccus carnicancri TaxID=558170 RepID=UPI0003174834|nr:VOC family protein [Salinicoccus carnicancri]